MCIFTKDSKPKTAKKPIRCLKLVKKVTFSDGNVKYYALYGGSVSRPISYEIGETVNMNKGFEGCPEYQIKLNSKERLGSDMYKDYPYRADAGLHSFHPDAEGWKDAYSFMMEFFKQSPQDERGISLQDEKVKVKEDGTVFYMNINFSVCIEVLECEIPAGAEYMEGIQFCSHTNKNQYGYVSDQLKIIGIYKETNHECTAPYM